MEDIEAVEIEHTLSDDERQCLQCGEIMQAIGTQVRGMLELIPTRAVFYQDIYYTYACENCKQNGHLHTDTEGTEKAHTGCREIRICRCDGAYSNAEICYVFTISAGAGMESARDHAQPADDV